MNGDERAVPAQGLASTIPASSESPQSDVKLIAFYLPQFHPIPENDAAWGRGFTEWMNVTRSQPLFDEHYQPHLPGEFGFYDLRVPEVLSEQAALAKSYGIYGFCFYYYWFDGRRLLEKPLNTMLTTGQPDLPFCVCWANENWSRRWDGSDQEIVVAQTFSEEMRPKIIEDLLPCFANSRYIRIDGRPLFLVYRPDIIPDLRETIEIWRNVARQHGLELHIAACLTFTFSNPCAFGFDSGVEFPPHGVVAGDVTDEIEWTKPFEGKAFSYDDVVRSEITKAEQPYRVFRSIMPGWDNTPRRGNRGHLFVGAEPKKFAAWLSALVMRCRRLASPAERIIFVNAWNEWAEGAHIEPDQRFGRQWLAACARAIRGVGEPLDADTWQPVLAELEGLAAKSGDPALGLALDMLQRCQERMESLEAANAALSTFYLNWLDNDPFGKTSPVLPADRLRQAFRFKSRRLSMHLESPPVGALMSFDRARPRHLSGWICPASEEDEPTEATRLAVMLSAAGGSSEAYMAFGRHGLNRPDVAQARPELPPKSAKISGFEIYMDLRGAAPGPYTMLIGINSKNEIMLSAEPIDIVIL